MTNKIFQSRKFASRKPANRRCICIFCCTVAGQRAEPKFVGRALNVDWKIVIWSPKVGKYRATLRRLEPTLEKLVGWPLGFTKICRRRLKFGGSLTCIVACLWLFTFTSRYMYFKEKVDNENILKACCIMMRFRNAGGLEFILWIWILSVLSLRFLWSNSECRSYTRLIFSNPYFSLVNVI